LASTTRFELRYPGLTDAPNGPAQLQALAEDTDGWLCRAFACTSSTRPTITDGRPFIIRETDTTNVLIWDGSAWVLIAPAGGGGGGGAGATISTIYSATAVQSPAHNTETTVAFGVDVATDAAVTKSTSGAGHKFTLNQQRLWTISATVQFTENGSGGRAVDIRTTGGTVLAKVGSESSSENPWTANPSVTRRLAAATEIVVIAWQNSGSALALGPGSGNTVHIDIAGV